MSSRIAKIMKNCRTLQAQGKKILFVKEKENNSNYSRKFSHFVTRS